MDSSTTDVLFPLVATGAAISVASLALLQTDRVSRWTLSPSRLMAKRRQEYSYHWKTAVEKAHLQLDYCLAGGGETFNADPEVNLKNTTYLGSEEEQDSLIQRIVAKKENESKFSVLKLDRDPSDPMGDFYLFLMRRQDKCEPEFFQLPLAPFCLKLRQAFEDQLTTNTLCFVADASSGKASTLLEELVKEAKTGVALISEPLWMSNLARLAEARIFSNSKLQTMIFALCRLDAWALRDQAKSSHTVMISLPGQSTVATLLPLVQAAFPEDRHVFAYNGCAASVNLGMRESSRFRRGTLQTELQSIVSRMAQHPIRYTIPLPSNSPLSKSVSNLEKALAQLPITQAQAVESWMSSVDAFFRLKDDEQKNGYLPYVFKLSLLTKPGSDFAPSTDSFWSLSSLLQYVTGTRSRPVADGIMDAAREFLKDYNRDDADPPMTISEADKASLENCVFLHKSILLGNKTLKDTVLPTQHWTLKQASRAGCSCCGPDPYDEQEDEDDEAQEQGGMTVAGVDMSVPGAFASVLNSESNAPSSSAPAPQSANPGYVDGKLGFAFDPSKFS
jgi:hypothetical protein